MRVERIAIMTANEKTIWAAVFAKELNLRNPPPYCCGPTPEAKEAWIEWEQIQVHRAVENAAFAVLHLRQERAAVAEGWDDEVSLFLDQMLKR